MKSLIQQETRRQIAARVAKLPRYGTARWGRMTAHEMLCHLHDSYLCALGEKPAIPAGGRFERYVIKWLALYLPLQWPQGVPTRPEFEQGAGGTRPDDFARDRARLESAIGRFSAAAEFKAAHPVFGPLSRRQWMRWGYLHADHHLRQFGA